MFLRFGILVLAGIFLTVSFTLAGFDIPQGVYRLGQLDEAREHAQMYDRPITFIYSDKSTSCGLAAAATREMFRQLGEHTTVVYVDTGKDWGDIPAQVKKALNSPEAGKFIPKAVIIDQNLSEIILIIPYAEKEERPRLFRQAKEKLAAY
jgi:hypothetical protein